MHLSGLSPFGPIFGKELRVASRRRRNYLMRVLYLMGIMLILLWAWVITRNVWGGSSISARQQQQEQLGFFFFAFFANFSVNMMGLIGCVLTCTAINVEREQKTLAVLLMTPLTAWQIVAGKMFSRLLTALTLLGLGLPVLALVRLLGGVELDQMFGVVAMAIAMAMTSAALGLLLSIFVRRAYAVILLSYLLMGIAYVFTPMIMMIWVSGTGRRGQLPWFKIISTYNPIWCTAFLSSGQMRMVMAGWQPCVFIHIGVTFGLLLLSAFLLRRLAKREGEPAASAMAMPVADAAPIPALMAEGVTETDAMLPPATVRTGSTRPVGDNPILWRELRRPLMTSTWQRIAGALICIALMILTYCVLYSNNDLKDSDTQVGYACVAHALMMLLACVISATAIAAEKESDTWTILLASPVSGTNIMWSKAAGVLRRLLWPVVGIAVHFSFFVIGGVITPVTFVLIMVVVTSFNAIWIATGVTLSLFCRKVTVAVIINLALPVVLYGVVSILLAVFDELFHVSNGHLVEGVTWYLPFYYLGAGIGRHNYDLRPELPGYNNTKVSQGDFLAIAMVFGLLHLGVAAAILAIASSAFNSAVGRASQIEPLPDPLPRASRTPSWAAQAS